MIEKKPKPKGRCRAYIMDFGWRVRCYRRAGHKGPHTYNPWR